MVSGLQERRSRQVSEHRVFDEQERHSVTVAGLQNRDSGYHLQVG